MTDWICLGVYVLGALGVYLVNRRLCGGSVVDSALFALAWRPCDYDSNQHRPSTESGPKWGCRVCKGIHLGKGQYCAHCGRGIDESQRQQPSQDGSNE